MKLQGSESYLTTKIPPIFSPPISKKWTEIHNTQHIS